MSAISAPSRLFKPRPPEPSGTSVHDVTDCIKSWGRSGIIVGAAFGFVLGAIFVAIPFSSDVLTFGVMGTLLVGTVECAVIAGGFAALGAALFANGAHGRSTPRYDSILRAGRRSAVAGPPDIPLAEWPARWAYPVHADMLPVQQVPAEELNTAFSLPDIQAHLDTIDAWENGNSGP